MRTQAKPNAPHGQGISAANCYRASIRSAASDLEALVDAYGADAIMAYAFRIQHDIAQYGDSINNWQFNIELNAKPLPAIRKQNKTKGRKGKK